MNHHDSAEGHVSGESEFVDDRPLLPGELHLGLLTSEKAHAVIKKIDFDAALKVSGVVAVFTAKDVKHNSWGAIIHDQPLFADAEVHYVGEVIACFAAENRAALQEAIKKTRIVYEEWPAILSIREAIQQKSFIGNLQKIERGDIETALKKSPHRLTGTIVIRGAEHFYLENQSAIAYPREEDQIEIHASSQHPTEVQHVAAEALGLSSKDIVCIVKRMGGGFGGKESQAAPIAAYAALAAHKLRRPARMVLTKDEDMLITGKRNPFENEYRIGFDNAGRILGLEMLLYSDGGAYADLSTAIMERAMLHTDNAYFVANIKITGQVCRTNFHPHTAFRGFGAPKGMLTTERIIEEIAHFLKIDALDIRKLNCYQNDRSITPYGQKIEDNLLPELFEKLENQSEYRKRRTQIETFNRDQGDRPSNLRGLSLTAVNFGISFTTRYLNQGNALVNIYRDGSVQVSTGATEMGQGVNTRIKHLVAEELGISPKFVRVMPTSTEKNANTSPTAASSGADLNGAAAVLAAQQIKFRLSQLAQKVLDLPHEKWATQTAGLGTQGEIEVLTKAPPHSLLESSTFDSMMFEKAVVWSKKHPEKKITFGDLVQEAYLNRISLSEHAHYKIPNLTYNKLTGEGRAFLYFVQGVAASDVSINCFTGDLKVLRTDILMDLGRIMNAGLDLGQIKGAFIQGMGWMTTENLFYSEQGKLLSHGPSTYKIPSIQDIPREFNVNLLENATNEVNLRSSKAVGEPPLLLCVSVWTAIQNALSYHPHYQSLQIYPCLQVPATSEIILRALMPERFAARNE